MDHDKNLDYFFKLLVKEKFYPSVRGLKNYLNYVFQDINFTNKRVLDIGGGKGVFSFVAALKGAAEVFCLEPDMAGSSQGNEDVFSGLRSQLNTSRVIRLNTTFQDFKNPGDTFDIILLHNSINHMDEAACSLLHKQEQARDVYRHIFQELYADSSPGARVIICDCAKTNFWPRLGLKNPFNPTIEWHKHQDPALWNQLLQDAGFSLFSLEWTSFSRLGKPGRILLGNYLGAFFTRGHFRLEARR